MNRITINLSGREFNIKTEENESYVQGLCDKLNAKISEFMSQSADISVSDAYMLTAFSMADDTEKNTSDKDNIRKQLIEALEDSTKLRAELSAAKKENEALKRELSKYNSSAEEAEDVQSEEQQHL